jgi:Tfp pilus assembly protein PilZ
LRQKKERRKCQRKDANVLSWAVSLDSLYTGNVNNLSGNGLFINTSQDIPVGSIIGVEFSPPNLNKPICIDSKVVWSRKNRRGDIIGIGVEFLPLSKEDKEVIEYYLSIISKGKDERT